MRSISSFCQQTTDFRKSVDDSLPGAAGHLLRGNVSRVFEQTRGVNFERVALRCCLTGKLGLGLRADLNDDAHCL